MATDRDKFEDLDPAKIIEEMRQEYWRGLSTPEAEESRDQVQVLVAEAGGERFALDALNCRTIIKVGRLTRVPRLPDCFLGVINLRGEIVSVVDLGAFFGLPVPAPGPKARLLLCESEGVRLAFQVNRIFGIEWVPRDRFQEPQTVTRPVKTEYVKGQIAPAGEEGWTIYLDVAKLIQGRELTLAKE